MIKSRTRSVRKRQHLYQLFAFGSLALACTNETGATESEARGTAPSASTLCELVPGETTFDEAEELLGKPAAQSGAMNDDVAILSYSYGAGALSLSFVDGILSMAPTVVGIDYPDCWSD